MHKSILLIEVLLILSYNVCHAFSEVIYVQDTTINTKLVLWNNGELPNVFSMNVDTNNLDSLLILSSIKKPLDDHIHTIFGGEIPCMLFCNATRSEFLLATPHYGTCKQCYRAYYIGYMDYTGDTISYPIIATTEPYFYTESGIHLGMPIEDVIALKGDKFKKKCDSITYYYISSYIYESPEELEYYQQNNYGDMFMTFVIKNKIVIGIAFGYIEI